MGESGGIGANASQFASIIASLFAKGPRALFLWALTLAITFFGADAMPQRAVR